MASVSLLATLADQTASQIAGAQSQIMPSGVVLPFSGTTAPTGWLLCYGQAVSRTIYAALFSSLSTTYGAGDGTTTFNLPDLRGRIGAGKDDMGGSAAGRLTSGGSGITGTTLGAAGGTQTHTLTATQSGSPGFSHTVNETAHFHAITTFDQSGYMYFGAPGSTQPETGSVLHTTSPVSGVRPTGTTYNSSGRPLAAPDTTGITVNSHAAASASTAHQNTQPTVILNYIIKV